MPKLIVILDCSECKAHNDTEMFTEYIGNHSSIKILHKCRLNGCILDEFPTIPSSCHLEDV